MTRLDREQIRHDLDIVKGIGVILLIIVTFIIATGENSAWNIVPGWVETVIFYAGFAVVAVIGLVLLYYRYTVPDTGTTGGEQGEDRTA